MEFRRGLLTPMRMPIVCEGTLMTRTLISMGGRSIATSVYVSKMRRVELDIVLWTYSGGVIVGS